MKMELLDVLVKLASAGTSGVCVLAIFWAGYCLKGLPPKTPVEQHRNFRYFMNMCICIALISGTAASISCYFNYRKVIELNGHLEIANQNNEKLEKEYDKQSKQYFAAKESVNQMAAQVESLNKERTVLKTAEKEFDDKISVLQSEYTALNNKYKEVFATRQFEEKWHNHSAIENKTDRGKDMQ